MPSDVWSSWMLQAEESLFRMNTLNTEELVTSGRKGKKIEMSRKFVVWFSQILLK